MRFKIFAFLAAFLLPATVAAQASGRMDKRPGRLLLETPQVIMNEGSDSYRVVLMLRDEFTDPKLVAMVRRRTNGDSALIIDMKRSKATPAVLKHVIVSLSYLREQSDTGLAGRFTFFAHEGSSHAVSGAEEAELANILAAARQAAGRPSGRIGITQSVSTVLQF